MTQKSGPLITSKSEVTLCMVPSSTGDLRFQSVGALRVNQPSLASAILSFPEEERDAPAILDYTPTYQGFIRQKEAPSVVVEHPEQQEEKAEEVLEDSFDEIPDILLPSLQRPLRGKLKLPREQDIDEEGEEVEDMLSKDIIGELERKKKKRKEEEKAKAAAKSGSSVQGLIIKTSHLTGSKVPPPASPVGKRPHSSTIQTKEAPAEKR